MQVTEGQRHLALIREARSLYRLVGAGILAAADVEHVLHQAGRHIGKPDDEIAALAAWAAQHPTDLPLPDRVSR